MTSAQRRQIHHRISSAWDSMGAVMTLAFLDECIEIVEDILHPEPKVVVVEFEEPKSLTEGE